ncbi:R8 protein [Collariella sp. IMI 366227]|nr:R8 protein [Collariella sp. IMI 366227]
MGWRPSGKHTSHRLTSFYNGTLTVFVIRLVSTIGLRSTNKKVSRKAIQDVNVRKACKTILQPGAPIALRLQGTLLYGLSRVYSQQCHYVLTDAERVQAHMRAFYSALGGSDNALDLQAGRAKPKELILADDPEFELDPNLPAFHFDEEGVLVVPEISQASRKTSSQLSPLQRDGSLSSSNRSILVGFDLSQSPYGGHSSLLNGPFGAGTMTPGKGGDGIMPFGDEERELQALDDLGIEIDADGNIVQAPEEPQLPRLPRPEKDEGVVLLQDDDFIQFDNQGDVIMGGANVFHSDPPLPALQAFGAQSHGQQGHEQEQNIEGREVAVSEEASSGQAPIRVQRPRRRPILALDDQTKITRQELKSWSANYLEHAEKASQSRQGVTPAEARKNAFNLIFGRGIAGVGFSTGVPGLPHPLAPHFAGEGLHANLLGIIITHPNEENVEVPRGRHRNALEAFDLDEDANSRRVRRRLSDDEHSEDSQHGQRLPHPDDDGLPPILGDDELPPVELGRRAGSVLPDLPSDVPWNRPSSQIPSSSIKGGGPGSKPPSRHVSASPLHGRGSILIPGGEIERFSDDGDHPFLGSDDLGFGLGSGGGGGFAPLHSGPVGGGSGSFSDPALPTTTGNGTQTTSQQMRAALDREGRNFLGFVESVAREKGSPVDITDNDHITGGSANSSRRWVEFDSLFEAEDRKKVVVAQGFYHVLSLATKNVIRVKQEGQGRKEPFGVIRLGVEVIGA